MASFSDLFDRANNAAIGANWSGPDVGEVGVYFNELAVYSSSGAPRLACVATAAAAFTAHQEASFILRALGATQEFGVAVRVAAAARAGYAFVGTTAGSRLIRVDAGTITMLAGGGPALVAGDTVKLTISGTALTARRNGAVVLTATDSAIASGQPGVYWDNSSQTKAADDFLADDVAGPGGGAPANTSSLSIPLG